MNLTSIAALVRGEIICGPDVEISGVSGISDAREGDITYLSGPKLLKELLASKASAVLVSEHVPSLGRPQVKTANPQYAFVQLLTHFYVKPHPVRGVSSQASVAGTARIGEGATVYPFAYIGENAAVGSDTVVYPGAFIGDGSTIGKGCLIYPHVTIRESVTIGNGVIIHPGAVIGSDGFGYVFKDGVHHKIPQVGTVIVEDGVEIGANTTIDRATTGVTRIGAGTKIDNLVQIAHNVKIGRAAVIVAQVGIAGSSEIGDGVVLGGQVGVADHATIEAGVMVGAQSGLMGHVTRGAYSGSPAIPHRDWLKSMALFSKLPELNKRIRELEEKISSLERAQKAPQ
jgi:UDP-3-O-[3-hydroxymyristoyl] glucosamine N-acyltransferase